MNYTRLIFGVMLGALVGMAAYLLVNRFVFNDRSLPIIQAFAVCLVSAISPIIWSWKKVKNSLKK